MFNRLKLRYKVLVSPLLAVAGLAAILVISELAAGRVSELANQIQASWMTGLNLTREIESDVLLIQYQAIEDWTGTLGLQGEEEAEEIKQRILATIQKMEANETFEAQKVTSLREDFEAYVDPTFARVRSAIEDAEDRGATEINLGDLREIVDLAAEFNTKLDAFVLEYEGELKKEIEALVEKQRGAR
ncbi:MAG: hypothetical protein AAF725_25655, partial [Acidobacteriota bacterium]